MQCNQHFYSFAMIACKQCKCSGTYKNFVVPRERAKCRKQKMAILHCGKSKSRL